MIPVRPPKLVVMDPNKLSYFAQAQMIRTGITHANALTGLGDPRMGRPLHGLGFSLLDSSDSQFNVDLTGAGDSAASSDATDPATPPNSTALPSFDDQLNANSNLVANATNNQTIDAGFFSTANVAAAQQQAAAADTSNTQSSSALQSVSSFLTSLSKAVTGGSTTTAQKSTGVQPTPWGTYALVGGAVLGAGFLLYVAFGKKHHRRR